MKSRHDRAWGAIFLQSFALAFFRNGEFKNTFSVIISIANIEGYRRIFP
jgi:hypothetical protein